MKRLALAALTALAFGPVSDRHAPASDTYLTPQSTVSSYWHRMLEHRHLEALECFVGGATDPSGMMSLPSVVELHCSDFQLTWRGGGTMDVTYDVVYRMQMGDSLQRFVSGDRMQLTGEGWKIARPMLVASAQTR